MERECELMTTEGPHSGVTVRVSPCMAVSGKDDLGNPSSIAWKEGV